MGFMTAVWFVGLFVGLSSFRCNNINAICENEVAEIFSEESSEGDGNSYPFYILTRDNKSDKTEIAHLRFGQFMSRKPNLGRTSQPNRRRGGRGGSLKRLIRVFPTDSRINGSYGGTTARTVIPQTQPGRVTDADIEAFTNDLWNLSADNVNNYITLNLGPRNPSGTLTAMQPLMQVDQTAMEITTIANVRALHNSYKTDITKEEDLLDSNTRENENILIDNLMLQPVIAKLMDFLKSKGFINQGMGRKILTDIWFGLHSREGSNGIKSSSGFQNVFLAELRTRQNKAITGLHNWIYFYDKEIAGKLIYNGYSNIIPLGKKGCILKYIATFVGKNRISIPIQAGVMFIGTSPEMEIALYTLCFFVRPDGKCPVSLDGTKLNIITESVTEDGTKMISSAYPEVL